MLHSKQNLFKFLLLALKSEMKKFFLLLICFFICSEAFAVELPTDLKSFLKNKFPGITFKIDNSFVINNEIFLPLLPLVTKPTKKIEITYLISDKNLPKLLWFSNEWIFVKLMKKNDGTQTIVSLADIPKQYKERFLKAKFPNDLVVPMGLTIKEDEEGLIGNLPIKIEGKDQKSETKIQVAEYSKHPSLNGTLYLTSPDTGKIVYLDLNNSSMIQQIQTMGAPWKISFDKTNKLIFITDFAKDLIYEFKPNEPSIFKSIELPPMSSPRDIELSDDGSLAYVLENLAFDFVIYKTNDAQPLVKTKLPPYPTSFAHLKETMLIAITCSSTNRLVFLNSNDFARANQIMIDGGPEKIIADSKHNVFYIANRNNNSVAVVDGLTKTIKNTIQVGETPTSLALDPESKWLYVGNGKSNSINIINLETFTIADTIQLPVETQFPGDIKISSDGQWLIATSETTNKISIIDLILKKVAVQLDVGATTHAAYIIEN